MKDSTILVESIKKLLRRSATVHLLNMLGKVRAADLAEAFKSLDEEEKSATFRLLAECATALRWKWWNGATQFSLKFSGTGAWQAGYSQDQAPDGTCGL